VKCIGKLHDLIGIAYDFNHLVLVRLENAVTLNNFPNTFFSFGEGGIFGVDLGGVSDYKLFGLVF